MRRCRVAFALVLAGTAVGVNEDGWDAESTCGAMGALEGLSEVCAAPAYGCVAAFGGRGASRRACRDICDDASLRCVGAYDDANDDGRCPPGEPVECGRALYSKVCHCGAAGALPLAYDAPTPDVCELLERRVLVAADGSRGALEVQRLTFALPAGATTDDWVAPAHVKARAPDAPGQVNRVRAYSAERNGSSTFGLTVKVYPGGPPDSRGTSAHLGSLAVGAALAVPRRRDARWAVPAADVARFCAVVFGVGVVEALEPIAAVLAANPSSAVVVVAAARDAAQRIHVEDLRGLLQTYAGRLSVVYHLSRADAAGDGVCVPGETVVPARASEAGLRDAVGAWPRTWDTRFLVVGTGAMEHAAGAWLANLGFDGLGLLDRPNPWRGLR